MQVTPQCVVALTWTLKDTLGDELDTLSEPVEFLVGGDDLLARIEEALQGPRARARGSTCTWSRKTPSAITTTSWCSWSRAACFPAELEEGMTFEGLPEGTNPQAPADRLYTVTEIYPEHVVVDGNHPLAGIALRLHLKVEGVREATEEEIGRGSAGTGFFRVEPQAPGSNSLH